MPNSSPTHTRVTPATRGNCHPHPPQAFQASNKLASEIPLPGRPQTLHNILASMFLSIPPLLRTERGGRSLQGALSIPPLLWTECGCRSLHAPCAHLNRPPWPKIWSNRDRHTHTHTLVLLNTLPPMPHVVMKLHLRSSTNNYSMNRNHDGSRQCDKHWRHIARALSMHGFVQAWHLCAAR